MYGYNDYFKEELKDRPYGSTQEEIEDYFRLLDMMLEGYLRFKGLGSEQKLFSRGLVITESEMENYFAAPPGQRERDLCDPALAEAVDAAWDYIEERVEATLAAGGFRPLPGLEEPWNDAVPDGGEEIVLEGGLGVPDIPLPVPELPEGLPAELQVLWIDSLKRIFELDRAGIMAVVMALASVTDRRYERIFGFLQDDISRTRPTVGLLAALMARVTPRDGAEELLRRPLDERLFGSLLLSEEEDSGLDTPLILNPLMERLLLGVPEREEQFPEALTLYQEDPGIPLFFEDSAAELDYALADRRNLFCYLENKDEDTVLHLMAWYCGYYDAPLFVLDLQQLMRMPAAACKACLADLSLRIRLAGGRLAVRIKTDDMKEPGADRELSARRWKLLNRISLACEDECVVLFGEEKEPGELITRSVPFLSIPAPDVTVRTEIWSYFLKEDEGTGPAEDVVIEDLADCYDISYGMIRNTCIHARSAARVRRLEQIGRDMILESLRQLNQVDFSGLASYVRAVYSWDDITITEDQRALLKVACDRYRLRNRVGQGWGLTRRNAYGNGVSILLYGPPGTGKTMAAQVVASELGIPLYRVDISQIFSKYIGETEKNLSVIFDAARGSNVILFFDEADALFSKRTEISNSNDKYANSETAFLLQKIEEYDGMSILATNLYTNFDTAFVRRITYAVRLDSPDKGARYLLWTATLPEQAQLEEDLPFRFLAERFELSGANIKAILYSAAYMAGAQGVPLGMAHIVRAMEYEYRKLGRFIDREAFGPYAKYLTRQEKGGGTDEDTAGGKR